MFPLGLALLPGAVLPLHIFEPRYRRMVADLLSADDDMRFGVVLIERGRESGEERRGPTSAPSLGCSMSACSKTGVSPC